MSNNESDIIIAAGGILWYSTPYKSNIVLIHRTRHGDEWCLPKGKSSLDETPEQTAIREVKEETGCLAQIISFVGFSKYKINNKEKHVLYWNLKLIKDEGFIPTEEVDQIVWLPPQEALSLLTHQDQKDILIELLNQREMTKVKILCSFFSKNRKLRLRGTIKVFRIELLAKHHDKTDNHYIINALKLLEEAEEALNKNNIDIAWKCYHAAQRLEIFILSKPELKSKAQNIRIEAVKLNEWRKKAVKKLLNDLDNTEVALSNEAVYRASLIRDQHYDNNAHKDKLFNTYLTSLLLILISIVTLIIFHFYCISNNILFGVILFGLLGGVFSAANKIPSKKNPSRIPEQAYTILISIFKVVIGGVSALFIYVFIQSSFFGEILQFNILNISSYTYYVISFAAGFSEKLVLRAVSTITKEK